MGSTVLVANIAQNRLLENSPSSLAQAEAELKPLEIFAPDLTTGEANHTFVEAATFADDVKYHGGAWQSDFHFEQNPFQLKNDTNEWNYSHKTRNSTYGSANLIQWLSLRDDGDEYKESYIYNYIMNLYNQDEQVARSYALRLLIHYVGDIHQPFHNEMFYSAEFPDGDKGGNLVPLKSHYGVDELHALWDQIMYTQRSPMIERPINDTYWPTFASETTTITKDGQPGVQDAHEYENINVFLWSDESYQIAITKYEGITPDAAVPQWYLDENLQVCWDRITLGGYRLAYLMEYIYPATGTEELFLQ